MGKALLWKKQRGFLQSGIQEELSVVCRRKMVSAGVLSGV